MGLLAGLLEFRKIWSGGIDFLLYASHFFHFMHTPVQIQCQSCSLGLWNKLSVLFVQGLAINEMTDLRFEGEWYDITSRLRVGMTVTVYSVTHPLPPSLPHRVARAGWWPCAAPLTQALPVGCFHWTTTHAPTFAHLMVLIGSMSSAMRRTGCGMMCWPWWSWSSSSRQWRTLLCV